MWWAAVVLDSVDLEYSVLLEAQSHWSGLGPEHQVGQTGGAEMRASAPLWTLATLTQSLELSGETPHREL